MFVGSAKEKFHYHNTLLCLVKAMEGKDITVDLRNDDSYVCGHVDSVDGYMNISFSNAVYCDPQGNEYLFENLFLQARNIRYVHVPETTSILSTIQTELGGNKKPRPDKKEVNTSRKVKKALKQHMETVASLRINKDLLDYFLPHWTHVVDYGPPPLQRGGQCPSSGNILC